MRSTTPNLMESPFQAALRIAEELLCTEQAAPPQPRIEPEQLRQQLPLTLGPQGLPQEQVLAELEAMVQLTPRTSDGRFFNQLFAGRIPIATAAEWLSCLLNVSMYTYKIAGPMVLAEQEVVKRMCCFAGFPHGDGIGVPGGSMANLVGMLLGRNQALPQMRDTGSQGKPLAYYVSTEGHYSVRKNAGILGTGRDFVRAIEVDKEGRMCVEALEATLEDDIKNGILPCAVIATAGTTVMGSFDPIRAIAKVCQQHGVWLHVDGAFGGAMLLHPSMRKHLDGIELADSMTWDAHKAMGVPLMCSLILTRNPHALQNSLNEAADYLFQTDDPTLNPGTRSIQCGRRNDTLKLWAAWRQLGDEGWSQHIEGQLALCRYAVQRIQAEPRLHLCLEPASTTICFTVDGMKSPDICQQLHEKGLAMIGYGKVFGEDVMRLVTVNPAIKTSDLDCLFDNILSISTPTSLSPHIRC